MCFNDSVCWVSIETLEKPCEEVEIVKEKKRKRKKRVTFKFALPCLDDQWGLCIARTEEIRERIHTLDWAQRFCLQFSLHANEPISKPHLSARGWIFFFFFVPSSRVCSEIVTHCAGLCMVINIECDIIVFLAACWWAILRSPSWVTTKSRRRSRTRGRKWSDRHAQTLAWNNVESCEG